MATGLPMMLTSLAILPRQIAASSLSRQLARMGARHIQVDLDDFRRAVDSAKQADSDDYNEIVAAVGGLGGGIQLVGMHVSNSSAYLTTSIVISSDLRFCGAKK